MAVKGEKETQINYTDPASNTQNEQAQNSIEQHRAYIFERFYRKKKVSI